MGDAQGGAAPPLADTKPASNILPAPGLGKALPPAAHGSAAAPAKPSKESGGAAGSDVKVSADSTAPKAAAEAPGGKVEEGAAAAAKKRPAESQAGAAAKRPTSGGSKTPAGSGKGKGPAAGKEPATGSAGKKKAAPKKKVETSSSEEESSSDDSSSEEESDSDDDVPLAKRKKAQAKKATPAAKGKAPAKKAAADTPAASARKRKAEPMSNGRAAKAPKKEAKATPAKRSKAEAKKEGEKEVKWNTLVHAGVLFPPEYEPHGVKMRYDGQPVDLTPEQEEIATMYAVMLHSDYPAKKIFNDNFWAGWKPVLGKGHVIKSLDKCDFTPIHEWAMAERERKKALSKEEKLALKEEKEKAEAKYQWVQVDGRLEKNGNYRVEPPGLFRGRGEQPRMGTVKRRIYPRDITINIGREAPIPEHPYPGQDWAEVRHDRTVTWLAYWRDPVLTKGYKYVWLGANSLFKTDSDQAKYERARKLKDCIGRIRADYMNNWESKDKQVQQMGVALYFIDKLALRAGHEKDEDEADTVGCCTLKVENVECLEGNLIKFDFLGKDSIRYENEVKVDPRVHALVKNFRKKDAKGSAKKGADQLFDKVDANDLNKVLKELMDGLSVKVFRTYNASITLDQQLHLATESVTLEQRLADYARANKAVAILCNHQRAVPKGHADSMQKMGDKLLAVQKELKDLQDQLKAASKDKKESLQNRVAKKGEQLQKLSVQQTVKEDLKTVALGTSKINYLDPRITVAWCKNNEVPLEKVFNKALLTKFFWAMDVEPSFRF